MAGIRVRVKLDKTKLDAIYAKSPQVAAQGAYDAADWVRDYIRSHWSPTVPSSPGQPPAVETGALDKSIFIQRRTNGKFAARSSDNTEFTIGSNLEYARALELGKVNAPNTILPRPYLRPALEAARARFGSFFEPIINARTPAYRGGVGSISNMSFLEVLSIAGALYAAAQLGVETVDE